MDDALNEMERAYAAGNHARARELARGQLASGADEKQRAERVLTETEVDWFLPAVAALGLGLTAWLVYNYWL
jgi:hypothetical protein